MDQEIGAAAGTRLACAERIERFLPGSTLFNEGDTPRGMYIVHSGEVDLVFSARNGFSKKLRSVHAGEILGLSDIVTHTTYDCTAITGSQAQIGFVSLHDLERVLEDDPSQWFDVAAMLSAGVGSCWESMRSLSSRRGSAPGSSAQV